MGGHAFKRVLQIIPTLIGVTILVFILIHALPGDPAQIIVGTDGTEEEVEMVRERLGLNKPLHEQYLTYVSNIFKGDIGTSLRSNNPVMEEILVRLPTTLKLTFLAVIFMVVIGLFTGIYSATKPNSAGDNVAMMFSLFGLSMPVFWLGLMLILLFSYSLNWFPSGGDSTWKYFVLPSFALALSSAAIIARLTRSSMLEVINQDFIRTARAKGVHENVVIYSHALKNSLIPIITIIGLEFGTLLGGAVLTETVFSMNGLGLYVIQSIQFRDYPAIQGCVLFIAMAFVIVNLLVDLCYGLLDPRIRYD